MVWLLTLLKLFDINVASIMEGKGNASSLGIVFCSFPWILFLYVSIILGFETVSGGWEEPIKNWFY